MVLPGGCDSRRESNKDTDTWRRVLRHMAKRALVMSGGGAKGAFELGAIDYLVNDRKLDFDVIAGVSVGSLNAVLLAQGQGFQGLQQQVKRLKDVWFGIRGNDDIYRTRLLGKL